MGENLACFGFPTRKMGVLIISTSKVAETNKTMWMKASTRTQMLITIIRTQVSQFHVLGLVCQTVLYSSSFQRISQAGEEGYLCAHNTDAAPTKYPPGPRRTYVQIMGLPVSVDLLETNFNRWPIGRDPKTV